MRTGNPTIAKLLRSSVKFLIVGALSTLIEFAVFNLLVFGAGVDVVGAKIVASLAALVNAYFGNREWVFRHRRGAARTREMTMFLLVNVICTLLGAGIVALGLSLLDAAGRPLLLNAINLFSVGVVVIFRFALYHYFVFPNPKPTDLANPAQH